MARHAKNDLLSSLDEAKATARVRGDEVRVQRPTSSQRSADLQRPMRSSGSPARVKATRSGNTGPARPTRSSAARRRSQRSIGPILLVLLVVALFVAAVFIVRSCSQQPEDDASEQNRAATYVSPYDWKNLVREDSRWAYVVDGQVKSRLGIDVSENQHEIDWDLVANDGIDFAMIRLGYRGTSEGDLYLDAHYWDNLDGARAAGIDCGLYFFSQAINEEEAREEAEFVLTYLNGTPLEYPIAFDSEEVALGIGEARTAGLSKEQMTAIAEAFCQRIEQDGYTAMVYGNASDISRYRRAAMERRLVWWAEYGSPMPLANIDIAFWQYSNEGQVDGISTYVDMNMDLRGAL